MHDYNLVPRTDITEIRFEYCLTTGGLCEVLLDLREGTAYHVLASIAVGMCSDAEVLARHAHLTLLIWVNKEARCVQSHLQFGTCTNKHGANRFHHIGPLVVQFQNCSFLEQNLKSLSTESTYKYTAFILSEHNRNTYDTRRRNKDLNLSEKLHYYIKYLFYSKI